MKKYLILFMIVVFAMPLSAQVKTITFAAATGSDGTAPDTSNALQIVSDDQNYLAGLLCAQAFADSISFLVSKDGTNYFKLNMMTTSDAQRITGGAAYYVEVDSSAAAAVTLPRDLFWPWDYLKIISDSVVGASTTACKAVYGRR